MSDGVSADFFSNRLENALVLTNTLAASLTAEHLQSKIPNCRSNTIGSQFWCLVGARESYRRAIENGAWDGFSCSLDDDTSTKPQKLRETLDDASQALLKAIANASMDDARWKLTSDAWEHEVQHHGQLIRYFYANAIPFPSEFAERYALS